MVSNITTILQRFTGEWAMLLQPEVILTICREIGDTAWRDRVLTPITTMQLFLLQILHGPTATRSHSVCSPTTRYTIGDSVTGGTGEAETHKAWGTGGIRKG